MHGVGENGDTKMMQGLFNYKLIKPKALLIRDKVFRLFVVIFGWAFVYLFIFFCVFMCHFVVFCISQITCHAYNFLQKKKAQNTVFHLIVMKNTNTELMSWIISKEFIEIKHLLLRNAVIICFLSLLFFLWLDVFFFHSEAKK